MTREIIRFVKLDTKIPKYFRYIQKKKKNDLFKEESRLLSFSAFEGNL